MKTRLIDYIILAAVVIITACSSNSNKIEKANQNTAALHDEQTMKKTIRSMVRMMHATDGATVRTRLTIFFSDLRRDEAALTSAMDYSDKYLNNPASPYRNEEQYINLLSTLLDVDSIPPSVRSLASERLRIASLNRVGVIANDFQFEMPDESRRSLYEIELPLTLVIFYNPECGPCERILSEIAANQVVNTAIDRHKLAVVAIYAEGDREVWRNNLADMPENWTVGYDLSAILDNDLYNLPAMPTLYLLDTDKRVLLKDPTPRRLLSLLRAK